MSPSVPDRYRGVWSRTLLQTPGTRDERSFVRWLQTSYWHADLRIPPAARAVPSRPDLQQGFCGLTTVEPQGGAEVCAWHRQLDFQPPRATPDAGRIEFDGPDRLIETGIHADYLEVWERVDGSTGRYAVLESHGADRTRLLIAGCFAMRVRARSTPWPPGTTTTDSLADVVQRHAGLAVPLLDFEISFGRVVQGRLRVEQSTLAGLEGCDEACSVQRLSEGEAVVRGPAGESLWKVLEWEAGGSVLG